MDAACLALSCCPAASCQFVEVQPTLTPFAVRCVGGEKAGHSVRLGVAKLIKMVKLCFGCWHLLRLMQAALCLSGVSILIWLAASHSCGLCQCLLILSSNLLNSEHGDC